MLSSSLTFSDLGRVVSFLGATGSIVLGYILPGFSFYLMFPENGSAPKWKRRGAIALIIAGFILGPITLLTVFL